MKVCCCNVKTTPLTLQQPNLKGKKPRNRKKGKKTSSGLKFKINKKIDSKQKINIKVVQDYHKITEKLSKYDIIHNHSFKK